MDLFEKLVAGVCMTVLVLLIFGMSKHGPVPVRLTESQKRTLEQRVRDLTELGQLEYGVAEMDMKTAVVDYSPRDPLNMAESSCDREHGRATRMQISINERLAAACFDEVMNETIPHEAAHLVMCQSSDRWPEHGPEWANIVRYLGAEPKEFHSCQ